MKYWNASMLSLDYKIDQYIYPMLLKMKFKINLGLG